MTAVLELPSIQPDRNGPQAARRRRAQRLAQLKQRLAAWAAVPLRSLLGSHGETGFGVLMYHRVTPVIPGRTPPTWNVPPDQFRRQIAGLLALGYEPWTLRRAIAASLGGSTIPRNAFVVTFDDGFANNYWHAWPILLELNVPATIFLATAFLDSEEPFPFDLWPHAGDPAVPQESWKPLTTGQCAEMRAGGLIEFGSHTHTHGDFRGRPEELLADVQQSLDVLREKFGLVEVPFAFPYGTRRSGFSSPVLAEAVRRAGAVGALTTEEELVIPGTDSFDWGRFTALAGDTPRTLAAKLDGWYKAIRGCWRSLRG